MPTYEYECRSCGHRFDFFQNMMDEPLKECPACGKELRRLINGGGGVIFKGSGFYATDKNAASKREENGGKKQEGQPACAVCPHAQTGVCAAQAG
ncbi:MAG: hypothetical protein LBD20_01225 [Spirochaetaceae bacterium]|jgi:putative FmdB family regulatory protein|nr:hypothetical protein [Spirochaetaceae bacterium]